VQTEPLNHPYSVTAVMCAVVITRLTDIGLMALVLQARQSWISCARLSDSFLQ